MSRGRWTRVARVALPAGLAAAAAGCLALWGAGPVAIVLAAGWTILVLAAALGLTDGPSRAHILGALASPGGTGAYRRAVSYRLGRLMNRYADPVPDAGGLWATFRAALTWRIYDGTLVFAVLYPTLAVVTLWAVTGQEAAVGGARILDAHAFWPYRAGPTLGVVLCLVTAPLAWWVSSLNEERRMGLVRWLPVLTGTVSAVFLVAAFEAAPAAAGLAIGFLGGAFIAGASSVAVVGASTVVGAAAVGVATCSALMKAGIAPILIAIGLVVAAAVTVDTCDGNNRPRLGRFLISLALPIAWVAAMTFLPWPLNAERARGVFLFLAVFPLLLALVAAPVFALQIALAAEGLRRRRGLAYGLLGALAGLAGSVVLSALFALAIGLLDVAAGRPVFSLAWILEGILVRPAEHAWLIPVLAAPLLPVIAHAAVALVNLPQAVPGAVRRALARFADREGVLRGTLSALGIGTLWSVPFLLAAILWWAALGFAGEAIASATWMWVTALRGVAVTAGFF